MPALLAAPLLALAQAPERPSGIGLPPPPAGGMRRGAWARRWRDARERFPETLGVAEGR